MITYDSHCMDLWGLYYFPIRNDDLHSLGETHWQWYSVLSEEQKEHRAGSRLLYSRERSKLSMLFLQCFMNIEHYGMTVQGRYSSRDFFDQP